MAWRVPLADVVLTEADLAAVDATLRSGWLTMGPRTADFEAAFADYLGVRHAVAVSSGTAALHLLYLAVGFGPGDEVVLPSMTFVATANALRYVGATPVFADIAGLREPWLDPDACAAAIGPRTAGIVHVPYGGHPGALHELAALASEHGLAFVQDAAHAVGARCGTTQVGAVGRGTAYSFFSNKNLAIGEGGMVATDDDALAERVRLLRSHGMTTLTWDRHRGHAAAYDVVALGFNYRLDEPRAALGVSRLARLDAETTARAALAARYREAFAGRVMSALEPVEGTTPAHHLFCIVLEPGADRDAVRAALAARGVQSSVHYPPIHRFAVYEDAAATLPVTEAYGQRTVTLPLFAHLTAADQDVVIAAVLDALAEAA